LDGKSRQKTAPSTTEPLPSVTRTTEPSVHLDQSGLELPDELEETDEEDDGAVEAEREAEARVLGVGETEVLLLAGGEGDAEEESD